MTVLVESPTWMLVVGLAVIVALYRAFMKGQAPLRVGNLWPSPSSIEDGKERRASHQYSEAAYYDITALEELDISDEDPIKLRPFKPKYHLTMGIENIPISDLLAMDRTYTSRIRLREALIREHGREVLAHEAVAHPAIFELYTYLLGTYLPQRFPTCFTLTPTNVENDVEKQGLLNRVTNAVLPLYPLPSAQEALTILGENVDTDFLFLLPSPLFPSITNEAGTNLHADGQGISPPLPLGSQPRAESQATKYHLRAYVTCFPSGFRTLSKLNLPLAAIHGPVPGYAAKLERSMDRFFAGLPVGKVVRRANWAIMANVRRAKKKDISIIEQQGENQDGTGTDVEWDESELCNFQGNHMSEEEHASADRNGGRNGEDDAKSHDTSQYDETTRKSRPMMNIDPYTTILRCERQTLHRLPRTKALVFAFKTYTYPLHDIKHEGRIESNSSSGASGSAGRCSTRDADGCGTGKTDEESPVSSAEALAQAVEGLGRGSVPGMTVYKRQIEWGEGVVKYLRS